jgi:phage replication O-like protein O
LIQFENGYTRIANNLFEAIMLREFTKRQRKILDLILRLSYGCNKGNAIIPYQRDFEVVGINEADIKEQLDWLEDSKIILRQGNQYSLNENIDDWQISRVQPFQPERLSELLRLNLKGTSKMLSIANYQLGKPGNTSLVKHESGTSQNTNSIERDLASAKDITKDKINKNLLSEYKNYVEEDSDPVTAEEWKEKALPLLKKKVNQNVFNTYLGNTIGISHSNHHLVVGCVSRGIMMYLNENLKGHIEEVLWDVYGESVSPVFDVICQPVAISCQ